MADFYNGNPNLKAENHEEIVTPAEFEWRVTEIIKCRDDILYFAKKYFYIVSPDDGKHIVKLFDKQTELIKSFQDHDRVVTLAARQTGKTTAVTVYLTWLMAFSPDKSILVCANKQAAAKEVVMRVKLGFEMLPLWLKPGVVEWSQLGFRLSNGSRLKGIATSPDAARGESANVLVLEEAAFVQPNIMNEFWSSVYPIISSGKNTQVIMVSTPNGTGNLFYETYEAARLGLEGGWHLEQINWDDRPGRDEVWKRKTIASFNGDMQKWAQEFGNCFIGSSQTLLKPETITKMKSFVLSEDWFEPEIIPLPKIGNDHINIKQWFKPIPGRTYAIGGDVADGIGGDSSVALVFDVTEVYNCVQVASFVSNQVSPSEFAYILTKLAVTYNNANILCESNNMGSETLRFITQIYEYENVINYGARRNLGIYSIHSIKAKACLFTREILSDPNVSITFYDKNLVSEVEYFEKKHGRDNVYQAIQGKHDDLTMSMIWGLLAFHPDICENYFDVRDVQTTSLGFAIGKVMKNFESSCEYSDTIQRVMNDPDAVYDKINKVVPENHDDFYYGSDNQSDGENTPRYYGSGNNGINSDFQDNSWLFG